MGERKCVYRVLMGKSEGKRQIAKLRSRLKDNITMNLQEVGWGHGLDRAGSG
jgi:hypothetical protein